MPGQGTQGRNSLVPACQCKTCMAKAGLLEAQFKGVYRDTAA